MHLFYLWATFRQLDGKTFHFFGEAAFCLTILNQFCYLQSHALCFFWGFEKLITQFSSFACSIQSSWNQNRAREGEEKDNFLLCREQDEFTVLHSLQEILEARKSPHFAAWLLNTTFAYCVKSLAKCENEQHATTFLESLMQWGLHTHHLPHYDYLESWLN